MTTQGSVQQRAQAASARGRHDLAARMLRRALNQSWPADDERVRMLISLGLAEAELGGLEAGLAVLDEAAANLSTNGSLLALLHGQRGVLLLRSGHYLRARPELDAAADSLPADDPERVKVLINRGIVALRLAELSSAAEDFEAALEAAKVTGLDYEAAVAILNLGYLRFLSGDLPNALALAADAETVLAPQSRWLLGICARGRAEMLLAAGLLGDAETDYTRAIDALTQAGHRQDRGQAALGLAQIARLRQDYAQARGWARRAVRMFESRGAAGWRLLADLELTWIESETRPRLAIALAESVESRLAEQGLREEASLARLLRVGALLATGDTAAAAGLAGRGTPGISGTRLTTRLLARDVRAKLSAADGRTAAAQRSRTRGLDDLHEYQSHFGSVDLLTGATRIGIQLAQDGLRQALSSGRPAAILEWSEQLRATSSRMARLRPPRDEDTAELLATLRYVQASQRAEHLDGGPRDPELARQATALRRQIRHHSWTQAAEQASVHRPVRLSALREHLTDDTTVIALTIVDDQLHALVITDRHARHAALGDAGTLRSEVFRLRADLDQLGRARLPGRLRARVQASADGALRRVSALVQRAVRGTSADGPVVVVPSGQSAILPWHLLDPLRERQVCVVPSLTWWARQRAAGPVRALGREVHVAGPDVARAIPEVHAAAAGVDATVLTGDDATVTRTLTAMDGAASVHVAAHGRHEPDNPMFSRLLLADGWLYGHDLDGVRRLPEHAMLSACEAGLSSVRPGDEALGLTAALLQGGTRCVVSAVAKVNDEVAEAVGVAHHRALRAGATPAQALQSALHGLDPHLPAPLVCFGLGW